MRIVAGLAGGRTLAVPGAGTRPTSDRVREALFSRLEHDGRVAGARVLDLFAGSGALGLEAASRGASQVVLVESARAAVEVCRRNVTALGLPGVQVVPSTVQAYLRRPGPTVDLALLDPPYDLDESDLSEVLTDVAARLARDGLVVVERSSRSPEPAWPRPTPQGPSGLRPTDQRRYGETVLWFADGIG